MSSDIDLTKDWLTALRWESNGLLPAIAQEKDSGEILMVAWMNQEALVETFNTGTAVYWSRSRQKLWRKGEESGNQQHIHSIRTDCDGDVILLTVTQQGGIACHTGRKSCFFLELSEGHWKITAPQLKDPKDMYSK